LDAGVFEGALYHVTELVTGGSLDSALAAAGGKLAPRRALEAMHDVCAALEHAHGRGVLHRDLKPANILLHASGRARLVALGPPLAEDRGRRMTTAAELRESIERVLGALPASTTRASNEASVPPAPGGAASPRPPSLGASGRELVIERELGRGGMGVVYAAR